MAARINWNNTGKFLVPGVILIVGKAANPNQIQNPLTSFNSVVKGRTQVVGGTFYFNWGVIQYGANPVTQSYWQYIDQALDNAASDNKVCLLSPSYVNFNGNQANPYVVPQFMWNAPATYGGSGGYWFITGQRTNGLIYNASVLSAYLDFLEEMGNRYSAHPGFGGVCLEESTYMTTGMPGYSDSAYVAAYLAQIDALDSAFPTFMCNASINFGAVDTYLARCVEKNVGIGYPDTIPYTGNTAPANRDMSAYHGVVPIMGQAQSPDYTDWGGQPEYPPFETGRRNYPPDHPKWPGQSRFGRTGNAADGFTPYELLFHGFWHNKNTVFPISPQAQNPSQPNLLSILLDAIDTLADEGIGPYIPDLQPPDPPGFPGFVPGEVDEVSGSITL